MITLNNENNGVNNYRKNNLRDLSAALQKYQSTWHIIPQAFSVICPKIKMHCLNK